MTCRKILHCEFLQICYETLRTFYFSCKHCQKTSTNYGYAIQRMKSDIVRALMASTFRSHIGLSCLGHAAPLTMLKAKYLQAGGISAVSSVSVASCGFDFLSDTLTIIWSIILLFLRKRESQKKPHLSALRSDAELKCYDQHLFLKYSVPRSATLGHCHTI